MLRKKNLLRTGTDSAATTRWRNVIMSTKAATAAATIAITFWRNMLMSRRIANVCMSRRMTGIFLRLSRRNVIMSLSLFPIRNTITLASLHHFFKLSESSKYRKHSGLHVVLNPRHVAFIGVVSASEHLDEVRINVLSKIVENG
mmetsp:Transcript_31243/g.58247  ORF Transcript_31243/g.58247 Transcript_31243/m.58247 type:complete len:144 (+) Transcript_31243:22-453(+)